MKEQDIRPKALFDDFLAAAREDVDRLFSDHDGWLELACPACESAAVASRFEKVGFEYRECADCGSLYQSPRPPAALLDRFYRDSLTMRFFAERFYRETEDARRREMFAPRAAMAAEWATRLGAAESLADVGAGYGTFLEEAARTGAFDRLVAIEPAQGLAAVCREKGFDVIEAPVEGAASAAARASFATCFEVFEHVHEPLAFLTAMARVVRPGGVVLFTTLTISGFDLQELWEQSKSVMPPNHLNLFSIAGLTRVVERAGLDLVDISTPGRLDVDIVANMLRDAPALRVSRFARQIAGAPEETRAAFQTFLQQHRLSSHVRVIARRRA